MEYLWNNRLTLGYQHASIRLSARFCRILAEQNCRDEKLNRMNFSTAPAITESVIATATE
jgi:hypothetical protein